MIRKVVAAAAILVLFGAALLALVPFDEGPVRCGAPLFGAETRELISDLPDDTLVSPECGDGGVRRLVYATGLFVLGLTAVAGVVLSGRHLGLRGPA